MTRKRLIACFDVIDGMVTKAYKFQDNIEIDDARKVAEKICAEQIDEVIFYDITASSQKRQIDLKTVKAVAQHLTVPLTVGGGIRDVDDMREVLACGADKISIDSMAVRNPDIIRQGAQALTSERIVLSMQVKKVARTEEIPSGYQVMIDGARVATGMDGLAWAKKGVQLGAGEICVNSIDRDGTHTGYDLEITGLISENVDVPVIASGGAGKPEHLAEVFSKTRATAGIISSMLYSPRMDRNYSVREIKEFLLARGISVTPWKP